MGRRGVRRWWWTLWPALGAWTAGASAVAVEPAAPGWCDGTSLSSSVVRSYARAGVPGLDGGASPLLCGNERFGLRHIDVRHAEDWQDVAGGGDWQRAADSAITVALGDPNSVRCDGRRNTCAFRGVSSGREVIAVVARQDGKVITAYPG